MTENCRMEQKYIGRHFHKAKTLSLNTATFTNIPKPLYHNTVTHTHTHKVLTTCVLHPLRTEKF